MKHAALTKEHPYCHTVQIVMSVLFLLVWLIDTIYNLTIIGSMPLLAVIFFVVGAYLVSKSHNTVFSPDRHGLVSSGVYAWVRHPMYLGTLLFFLGLLFINFSLISLVVWLIFFLAYDRFASYEEKELVKKIRKYKEYQKKVGKWVPRVGF